MTDVPFSTVAGDLHVPQLDEIIPGLGDPALQDHQLLGPIEAFERICRGHITVVIGTLIGAWLISSSASGFGGSSRPPSVDHPDVDRGRIARLCDRVTSRARGVLPVAAAAVRSGGAAAPTPGGYGGDQGALRTMGAGQNDVEGDAGPVILVSL